jgi:hypothetical protein
MIWKEAVVAWCNVLSRHFSGGTEENYEKHQDSNCSGRDSNQAYLEYMPQGLLFEPKSSAFSFCMCVIFYCQSTHTILSRDGVIIDGVWIGHKLVLLITFRHGPHRKRRSSVTVQLLLREGMTYFIVACAAIGTDCAGNAISLLFTSRCLVTAGCCDFKVLALSEYATISTSTLFLSRSFKSLL